MSDLGPIKPLAQTIAVKPFNKDTAKKDNSQKKKDKGTSNSDETNSEGHINEYI
jgi:hypothetical protein